VIEKKFMLVLGKYVREFLSKDLIVLSDPCDFGLFCNFLDFLISGYMPHERNQQIGIFILLNEWESNFEIIDCFRSRLCCQKKDGIIVYNGEEYEVNIGCLYFHSEVFRGFFKNNIEMVFMIVLPKSRESFEVFLDLIHNQISYPSIEKAGDIYDICEYLHCDSLCQLMNDNSSERVLSLLIQNQDQDHNDNIDFSKYERSITQNIETYLKNPGFCLVSLPSLCRIFAASNQAFFLSSLEPFLIGCMKHHGTVAQCILNKIKYQKPSGISELKRFLHIMSIEGSNDIYENSNHVLSSLQIEFSSLYDDNRKLSESNQQTISEMNKRFQEFESIIQELKSEVNSAKTTIEGLKIKIQENESMLAEETRSMQVKDETIKNFINTIKEKDLQIKHQSTQINYCINGEYPLKSDLFSGIFDGLSKKLGRNLATSWDIVVYASSIYAKFVPENVLNNDSSIWWSEDLPNSWVLFDFKNRKVSITSYSINDHQRAKSWKVEGSNDEIEFYSIDNQVDTTGFKKSNGLQKNFLVQPNNKYYRYIRITSTSKNWNNNHFLSFYSVEFFGFIQSG